MTPRRAELVKRLLERRAELEAQEQLHREVVGRTNAANAAYVAAEKELLEELTDGDLHVGTARSEVRIVVPSERLIIRTQVGWSKLAVESFEEMYVDAPIDALTHHQV